MNTNCPICGHPLYNGNVKREKREGKRTRRVHRVCPGVEKAVSEAVSATCAKKQTEQIPDSVVKQAGVLVRRARTEGFLFREEPYRFFIRTGDADRIQRAADKGVTVQIEIYSVYESLYEAMPEAYSDFTEIKLEGE